MRVRLYKYLSEQHPLERVGLERTFIYESSAIFQIQDIVQVFPVITIELNY